MIRKIPLSFIITQRGFLFYYRQNTFYVLRNICIPNIRIFKQIFVVRTYFNILPSHILISHCYLYCIVSFCKYLRWNFLLSYILCHFQLSLQFLHGQLIHLDYQASRKRLYRRVFGIYVLSCHTPFCLNHFTPSY